MIFKKNKWLERQDKKDPKYFCLNCGTKFRTGKFSRFDSYLYDDICPWCGCPGENFESLIHEYLELFWDYQEQYMPDEQLNLHRKYRTLSENIKIVLGNKEYNKFGLLNRISEGGEDFELLLKVENNLKEKKGDI